MTLPTSGGGWMGEKEHGMEANKERYGEIKKEGTEKRGRGGGKMRGEWNKQRTMREKRVPEARNEKLQGWRRANDRL